MRIDSPIPDRVLFVASRNYTSDFSSGPFVGKIPVIHYDPGHPIHMGYGVRAQRPFQVSRIALPLRHKGPDSTETNAGCAHIHHVGETSQTLQAMLNLL